ncbi:MAG TPA: hypothetical protein VLV32_02050 [Burkholderiales bacterium]|nr:hypothetical protein [Burkholderiales bacterium]
MHKVIFVVLAMFMSGAVLAQTQPPAAQQPNQAQNFQERKQHILERMDQRIAALQKARDCVSQAQDKDAVKACFPKREGHHDGGNYHDRGQGNN